MSSSIRGTVDADRCRSTSRPPGRADLDFCDAQRFGAGRVRRPSRGADARPARAAQRHERPHGAVSSGTASRELEARDDVYCVLWRAEGRAFSTGRGVGELGNRGARARATTSTSRSATATPTAIWCPPHVPIVCTIQGWCIGGMWERSLLCDVRIAADDAKFRLPELGAGLIPDSGGTARLFQICGPALVSDLVLATPGARRRGGAAPRDRAAGRRPAPTSTTRPGRGGDHDRRHVAARGAGLASEPARPRHAPRCRRRSTTSCSAQMLVYTSEDFAKFRAARAEDRPPNYRIT